MMRVLRCASLLVGVVVFGATRAHAQVVHGTVVQAGTSRPLQDVAVSLRQDGRVLAHSVTDTAGAFWLKGPRIGNYEIVAERIGYATVVSPLELQLSEQVEVSVQLDVAAVPLEPLTVKVRSYYDLGLLTEFYERMARHERLGMGRFITRDQIDERHALDVGDLLREFALVNVHRQRTTSAYVTLRGGTSGECHPRVYLNGTLANRNDRAYVDELVSPQDLEGVEIYRGLAQLPGMYHDASGCGVILLWTRRIADGEGRPFSWKRLLGAVGAVGIVFFLILR
jgi:hypothetical protein